MAAQYTSKSIGWKAGHAAAHQVMAVSEVSAIAEMIPTAASFASFGTMCVPLFWLKIFKGQNRERCVNYFTLRIIIVFMETIKDLYQTPI